MSAATKKLSRSVRFFDESAGHGETFGPTSMAVRDR